MSLRYLIVGGVAGGMSAAARLRRLSENASIIVFEKGEYISYASAGLPYYAGGRVTEREQLVARTPKECTDYYNIDVRIRTEVLKIDRTKKLVQVKNHTTGEIYSEGYDKLLLSPGSKSFTPPIPGINLPSVFPVQNIPDVERILSTIEQNGARDVTLIGGGYIGVEIADNLNQIGLNVHIIELFGHVLATLDSEMAALVQERLEEADIHLHLNRRVTKFESQDNQLEIHCDHGEPIQTDLALLAMGIRPNIELAQAAKLEIGKAQGIAVNDFLQTSDPDIYAVGDAIEVWNPILQKRMPIALGGPASKQGRIAANNMVLGNQEKYLGTIGTSIAKVIDLDVSATGATANMLEQAKIPYAQVIVHPMAHAAYFPEAHRLSIKLLFDPKTGQVLGGQVIGKDGVLKTIDLIAFAIQHSMTVHDLGAFEHAYAPAYSFEKDPLNIAGNAASNVLSGHSRQVMWEELAQPGHNYQLIDVRDEAPYAAEHIDGAMHIPLSDLRTRMAELPTTDSFVVYSDTGMRGYYAAQILQQAGFKAVYNLCGGFKTYRAAMRATQS